VFLAALAIADDLGAVLVIALFYTSQLNLLALAAAFGLAGLLALLARSGQRRLWPFLIAAPTLWWLMHASGVHSTIAGVLLGWTIPLHKDAGGAPLTTLERSLKPWVTWGVMPLFALANAGVAVREMSWSAFAHPVALGVGLGLVLGKPLGILGLSFVLVRLGWAKLPRGATWPQLACVGMIAGIGFTVALFVSSLSFPTAGALEPLAKIGILAGSIAAAVLGTACLARALPRDA
jgi:NhaA family Na+:H+ antiporter